MVKCSAKCKHDLAHACADAVGITRHTLQPMDVLLPGQPRQRFTLLPPLPALDALSIVDMGRAADVSRLADMHAHGLLERLKSVP